MDLHKYKQSQDQFKKIIAVCWFLPLKKKMSGIKVPKMPAVLNLVHIADATFYIIN